MTCTNFASETHTRRKPCRFPFRNRYLRFGKSGPLYAPLIDVYHANCSFSFGAVCRSTLPSHTMRILWSLNKWGLGHNYTVYKPSKDDKPKMVGDAKKILRALENLHRKSGKTTAQWMYVKLKGHSIQFNASYHICAAHVHGHTSLAMFGPIPPKCIKELSPCSGWNYARTSVLADNNKMLVQSTHTHTHAFTCFGQHISRAQCILWWPF